VGPTPKAEVLHLRKIRKIFSSAFCAELFRKDFLKAVKAEERACRRASDRPRSRDRAEAGCWWETHTWTILFIGCLATPCTGKQPFTIPARSATKRRKPLPQWPVFRQRLPCSRAHS